MRRTYRDEVLLHHLASFSIEPSFRIECFGVGTEAVSVTVDDVRVDADNSLFRGFV